MMPATPQSVEQSTVVKKMTRLVRMPEYAAAFSLLPVEKT
jgi:hypothetical protein